jgi:hypothetical protein
LSTTKPSRADELRGWPFDTGIFSPEGFRTLSGARRVVPALLQRSPDPGQKWIELESRSEDGDVLRYPHLPGRDTIGELRSYAFVTLREETWPSPAKAAISTVELALAGVPVRTLALSSEVRALLPAEILEAGDRVDDSLRQDRGWREEVSIRLRRAAHQRYQYLAPGDADPAKVVVLLPQCVAGQAGHGLVTEVQQQVAVRAVPVVVVRSGHGTEPSSQAANPIPQVMAADLDRFLREHEAPYVTRFVPDAVYSPHHLIDLVQGLRHSGAQVARGGGRFGVDASGVLVERVAAVGECRSPGPRLVALWYSDAGVRGEAATDGYVIHGCSVVARTGAPPALGPGDTQGLVRHHDLPPQLGWARGRLAPSPTSLPSYFAR